MSIRNKIDKNINESKNTRLAVVEDLNNCRFNRDSLAHITRYLKVAEFIVDLATKFGRPIKILDIGCGEIYILRTISAAFRRRNKDIVREYVGIDIDYKNNRKVLDRFKALLKQTNGKVLTIDITTVPRLQFSKDYFDIVCMLETIEHVNPKFIEGIIKELTRVTKYYTIFSTPNSEGSNEKLPEDHFFEWSARDLLKIFQKHFSQVNYFGTFGQLKNLSKTPKDKRMIKLLRKRFDKNFVSLIMATFQPHNANNVIYFCKK